MNLNVAAKCHRAGRKQGSQQKPLELLLYLPYWPKVIMGGHDDPASEKRERHVTTQGTGENAVVDVIRCETFVHSDCCSACETGVGSSTMLGANDQQNESGDVNCLTTRVAREVKLICMLWWNIHVLPCSFMR